MSEPVTGKGLDRVDGKLKVTGKATYAAEVPVANIAHAIIVGATPATGTVASIDIAEAKRQPGVLAVITHENAPKIPDANKKNQDQDRILQLLQDDAIHYSDQPIALVIADTLERAQYAAELVRPQYTAGKAAVADLEADLANATTPKQAGPRGEPETKRGDFDKGMASAVFHVEATYSTPIETHHPMEMHSTIAVWQGSDHLTLYDSTQGIFNVRQRLATVFGLPKENVRVINHFVGGGFGSKGSPWSHVALAALGAKVVGRPVKLVLRRGQMNSLVGHRPKTIQKVALGCDSAGKLVAIKHEVTSETSRFDTFVEPSALQTRMLYSCPNVVTGHRIVRIDVPTPTFTRAPGESTGTYALESAMDELSYAAGLDPVELRVRNHALKDEQEDKPFSSKSLLECYKRGAEAFGWNRRKPKPRATREGNWLVGQGMATATYPARQQPASARAIVKADGSALVQAGTQDIGTGTYTIMTQIASDALGVPFDRVRFELGDTDLPETPLSAGSFTASSTGSAVKMACEKLKEQFAAVAKPGESYEAALKRLGKTELVAEHRTQPTDAHQKMAMHSFGAVFVEARVDEVLGIVRLSRITAAYAAGKILNAKTGRSQLMGGIIWGIGMALEEEGGRDPRTARMMTRGLDDYHVPVNADVPPIEIITVDEHDPYVNEIGAKGIGEIGNTGAAAAIANAVYHATGKRVRDLPIRLDKLIIEEHV